MYDCTINQSGSQTATAHHIGQTGSPTTIDDIRNLLWDVANNLHIHLSAVMQEAD